MITSSDHFRTVLSTTSVHFRKFELGEIRHTLLRYSMKVCDMVKFGERRILVLRASYSKIGSCIR
jgi:hypothetical protein